MKRKKYKKAKLKKIKMKSIKAKKYPGPIMQIENHLEYLNLNLNRNREDNHDKK